jgi:hypothetical protein
VAYQYELDALNYIECIVSMGEVEGIRGYLGKSAEPVYRGAVNSERARKAARAPRPSRVGLWIEGYLRDNPKATWKEVWRALETQAWVVKKGGETIELIDNDGTSKSVRVSGLKDRIGRARRTLKSR